MFGPETLSHSPLSSYFSTTPVTLFYTMWTALFCGKALISLQIPFFLNNYSLETSSLSPQEARAIIPLVSMSFSSTTKTFSAFFIMILGFPVLIIGLTHGLHSGILEGSPTTIAKQLSLIPGGTLVHPII